MGVVVNDKKREWSVSSALSNDDGGGDGDATTENYDDYYIPTPLAPSSHPTHTMDDSIQETIRSKLRDRSQARRNKQYKEADDIRDFLVEEYSIQIDDRTKEWKIMGVDEYEGSEGNGGGGGGEDRFGKEA